MTDPKQEPYCKTDLFQKLSNVRLKSKLSRLSRFQVREKQTHRGPWNGEDWMPQAPVSATVSPGTPPLMIPLGKCLEPPEGSWEGSRR